MHIRLVEIENLQAVSKFNLTLEPEEFAGWHVLIGDNGSGKSTVVRALALALAGPREALALRQNWSTWLRQGTESGFVSLHVDFDLELDKITGKSARSKNFYVGAGMEFKSKVVNENRKTVDVKRMSYPELNADRYVWGTGSGWFSCSFGPFRRFSGGNRDWEKVYYSNPRLAAHLSAFGEDVALTECIEWLQHLHVQNLENNPEGEILAYLQAFLNDSGMLPHDTVLEQVTSDNVVFRDGNGFELPVESLSDGYRSILSLTFELIRQMVRAYGGGEVFRRVQEGEMVIDLPGVVVVDEIDAHLHPSWQRRIGQWFVKYFPQIQFFVTTHSPLVCQAAEHGTVWRLPAPGSDEVGGRVTDVELQRLVFGSVLDAYGTDMFGAKVTRSEASSAKLTRLAALNRKELRGKLTAKERKELEELKATLPTMAGALDG